MDGTGIINHPSMLIIGEIWVYLKSSSANTNMKKKDASITVGGRSDQSIGGSFGYCQLSLLIFIYVFLKCSDSALSTSNEIVLWGRNSEEYHYYPWPECTKSPVKRICADSYWCEFEKVLTACWKQEMRLYFWRQKIFAITPGKLILLACK